MADQPTNPPPSAESSRPPTVQPPSPSEAEAGPSEKLLLLAEKIPRALLTLRRLAECFALGEVSDSHLDRAALNALSQATEALDRFQTFYDHRVFQAGLLPFLHRDLTEIYRLVVGGIAAEERDRLIDESIQKHNFPASPDQVPRLRLDAADIRSREMQGNDVEDDESEAKRGASKVAAMMLQEVFGATAGPDRMPRLQGDVPVNSVFALPPIFGVAERQRPREPEIGETLDDYFNSVFGDARSSGEKSEVQRSSRLAMPLRSPDQRERDMALSRSIYIILQQISRPTRGATEYVAAPTIGDGGDGRVRPVRKKGPGRPRKKMPAAP